MSDLILRSAQIAVVTLTLTGGAAEAHGRARATVSTAAGGTADADLHSPTMHAQLTASLDELGRLPDDWDGDGAHAPNATAIANAARVLDALARLRTSADYDVAPDALGGLAFGFYVAGAGERDRLRAYIECLNKGTVHVVFDDRTVADGVRARTLDPARLSELVDELQAFLVR